MATEKAKPLGGLSNSELASTTADASEVLSGQTFYSGDKELKTGTMVNNGAVSKQLALNGSYTIPAGYHDGNGRVYQNYPVNTATTYYASTSEQIIPEGYAVGNQTLHIVSGSNFFITNFLLGTSVDISSNDQVLMQGTGIAVSAHIDMTKLSYVGLANSGLVSMRTSSASATYNDLPAGKYLLIIIRRNSMTTSSASGYMQKIYSGYPNATVHYYDNDTSTLGDIIPYGLISTEGQTAGTVINRVIQLDRTSDVRVTCSPITSMTTSYYHGVSMSIYKIEE